MARGTSHCVVNGTCTCVSHCGPSVKLYWEMAPQMETRPNSFIFDSTVVQNSPPTCIGYTLYMMCSTEHPCSGAFQLMFTAWTDERYHAYFGLLVTAYMLKLHAAEHVAVSSRAVISYRKCLHLKCIVACSFKQSIYMYVPTCTCVTHHNTKKFEGIQDWRCQRRGQPH